LPWVLGRLLEAGRAQAVAMPALRAIAERVAAVAGAAAVAPPVDAPADARRAEPARAVVVGADVAAT
jgi:hypothetical protein